MMPKQSTCHPADLISLSFPNDLIGNLKSGSPIETFGDDSVRYVQYLRLLCPRHEILAGPRNDNKVTKRINS